MLTHSCRQTYNRAHLPHLTSHPPNPHAPNAYASSPLLPLSYPLPRSNRRPYPPDRRRPAAKSTLPYLAPAASRWFAADDTIPGLPRPACLAADPALPDLGPHTYLAKPERHAARVAPAHLDRVAETAVRAGDRRGVETGGGGPRGRHAVDREGRVGPPAEGAGGRQSVRGGGQRFRGRLLRVEEETVRFGSAGGGCCFSCLIFGWF